MASPQRFEIHQALPRNSAMAHANGPNPLEARHLTCQIQSDAGRRQSARFDPVGGKGGATRSVHPPEGCPSRVSLPPNDAEKIVSEALKLSAEERAELVDRLLRSLDDAEADALDEIDRD